MFPKTLWIPHEQKLKSLQLCEDLQKLKCRFQEGYVTMGAYRGNSNGEWISSLLRRYVEIYLVEVDSSMAALLFHEQNRFELFSWKVEKSWPHHYSQHQIKSTSNTWFFTLKKKKSIEFDPVLTNSKYARLSEEFYCVWRVLQCHNDSQTCIEKSK